MSNTDDEEADMKRTIVIALAVLTLAGGGYAAEWSDYNDADPGITVTP